MNKLVSLVAHEVGQPLAAISLNADAALRLLEEQGLAQNEDLVSAILRIRADCLRANQILLGLRDLMGGQVQPQMVFDLHKTVETVRRVIAPALESHGVTLTIEMPPGSIVLCGIPVLIEQLLVNLSRNAIEAMGRNTACKTMRIVVRPGATCVDIRVIDSGPGLSQAHAQLAFRPFYTTKPDGSGVGLNVCHMIAVHHGGELVLEPSDSGACFRVTLPLASGGHVAGQRGGVTDPAMGLAMALGLPEGGGYGGVETLAAKDGVAPVPLAGGPA